MLKVSRYKLCLCWLTYRNSTSADPNETKVYQKLAQLDAALKQGIYIRNKSPLGFVPARNQHKGCYQ